MRAGPQDEAGGSWRAAVWVPVWAILDIVEKVRMAWGHVNLALGGSSLKTFDTVDQGVLLAKLEQ